MNPPEPSHPPVERPPDGPQWYARAFSRNRGVVTEPEQTRLRASRVAVAGLGGVGGSHLLYLARTGVGKFHLADFDTFDVANVNRQIGATASTIGQPKAAVLAEMVRDINPAAEIQVFPRGVTADEVDAFLEGCDLVVDAIDFFAMDARELLHTAARRMGLPVLLSAPVGFSATLHIFSPNGMSFHDYFDIRPGMSMDDRLLLFGLGLVPRTTHWRYTDMSYLDPETGAGPSIACACALSTGLLTTAAVGLLLERRVLPPVPAFVQFDAYQGVLRRGRLRWGNRGPIQRLLRLIVRARMQGPASRRAPANR